MAQSGYSVVNIETGEELMASTGLPVSPAPPDRPFGRIATFTAIGQEADGYRLVERVVLSEKPSPYHKLSGETVAFDGEKTIVRHTYTAPPVEALKALRVAEIKQAASDAILSAYPAWKQTNMLAAGGELQDAWRTKGVWDKEQQALADMLNARWSWVSAVRTHSNALEAEIMSLKTADELVTWVEHGWPLEAP